MSKKNKKSTENNKKDGEKLRLATEVATRALATFVSGEDYLPNPDPILKAKGGNIKVYRNFVDSHLSSVKNKRFAAITSRPWTIDGSKGDAKKAKMLEEYLWNLEFRYTISQMLEAVGYGYAVHEIVWNAVETEMGTLILPTEIKDRPQEWFKFDDDGKLLFQDKTANRSQVPDKKFLVTRNRPTASNPYGDPVYSRCFWPLTFKKGGLKFWMLFVEKYGIPKALGKVPAGTTVQDQNTFLKMLSGLVQDAVAVFPNTGSVELLSPPAGTGSDIHSKLVQWADSEMSKAWLGETLTTEQTSSGGTQAMATVHNDVRADLAIDDAAMIESSINQLIRWIYEINWPTEKVIPWMNIILPEDLQQARLERDLKLRQLGVKFNAQYITDIYGIDEKYFEMTEVQQGAMFAEGPEKKPKVRNTSHELRNNVNAFTEHLANECEKIDFLAPIRELVENAKSLEEVRDKLGGCFGEMPMDKVADEMEQAFIAADLAGRFAILKKAGIIDG
jgi:phage gp29-like protein